MALKVGIARAAAATGTPNFTQDFTDSGAGFSTDVKAAIFISGNTTADHTTTAQAQWQFSIAAGSATAALSSVCEEGQTADAYNARYHNSGTTSTGGYAFAIPPTSYGSSGEFQSPVDFASVSNGVRVTWTDQSSSELIYALLLGGDIEANVVNAKFTGSGSGEYVTPSHGLSAAPEVIIAIYGSASTTAANGLWGSIGMWDGSTQQCFDRMVDASGRTPQARIDTTKLMTERTAGSTIDYTLSEVGASTLKLTATGAATSEYVSLLCLRGTSAALIGKCGVFSAPTGTGDSAMGLSMSVAPQALLAIQTVMTSTNASVSTDAADVMGALVAIDQSGTTKYGGVTTFVDHSASTSVAKTQTSNSQIVRLWDTTPTIDVEATVKTTTGWGADDITLNFSNVGASAFRIPYIALGMASGVATKYLKALTHSAAAGVASVAGTVFNAPAGSDICGSRIGEFTGQSFLGANSLDGGKAKLLVNVSSFGGSALTTSSAPVVYLRISSFDTGIFPATVIEV